MTLEGDSKPLSARDTEPQRNALVGNTAEPDWGHDVRMPQASVRMAMSGQTTNDASPAPMQAVRQTEQVGRYDANGAPGGVPDAGAKAIQGWGQHIDSARKEINEIYNRNGAHFGLPEDWARFKQQPGPNTTDKITLNGQDQADVDAATKQRQADISAYRDFRKAHPIPESEKQNLQVLPGSDQQRIDQNPQLKATVDQLVQNGDAFALKAARNELYARHGLQFQDVLLAEYFGHQKWYQPGGYKGLSETEVANDGLLKQAEYAALMKGAGKGN